MQLCSVYRLQCNLTQGQSTPSGGKEDRHTRLLYLTRHADSWAREIDVLVDTQLIKSLSTSLRSWVQTSRTHIKSQACVCNPSVRKVETEESQNAVWDFGTWHTYVPIPGRESMASQSNSYSEAWLGEPTNLMRLIPYRNLGEGLLRGAGMARRVWSGTKCWAWWSGCFILPSVSPVTSPTQICSFICLFFNI